MIVTSVREDEAGQGLHVARVGAVPRPLDAKQAVFIDEERLLTLVEGAHGAEVREIRIDAPDTIVWRHAVEDVTAATLSYRRATGQWRVIGIAGDGAVVRGEGLLRSAAADDTRWPRRTASHDWPDSITASGDVALVVETDYGSSLLDGTSLWQWGILLHSGRIRSRFSRLDGATRTDLGTTRLGAHCLAAVLDDDRLVCSGFDGSRTRFVAVDPATGQIAPLAWLPGRFAAHQPSGSGWLSGWWQSRAVAIHLPTREAVSLDRDPDGRVIHLAVSGQTAAALKYGRTGSSLRVYRLTASFPSGRDRLATRE